MIPYLLNISSTNICVFFLYDRLIDYTYHIINTDTFNLIEFNKLYNNIFKKKQYTKSYEKLFKKINKDLLVFKGNNINEKMINCYNIIERFIKYISELDNKYIKPKNGHIWFNNLILHKFKGLYRQFFIANSINNSNFDINILKKYIQLCSFSKLNLIKK